MKRVCVIGHFGFGHDLLNGQTIKTKIVADEIEQNVGKDEFVRIDTHGGFFALIKLPFILLYSVAFFRNVLFLPAHNGLRIIAPLLVALNSVFRRKLHYVVVGGWLPEFLGDKKFLTNFLKKVDYIYVETRSMKSKLVSVGFSNVLVMPNFKNVRVLEENELPIQQDNIFKLCTFSRVMKEKGIEDAVEAVKCVNEKQGKAICSLDIYGQIDNGQVEWFENLKNAFPEFIHYNGCIAFDKSVETLAKYDMLLFPTYYEGEGFAGTLIDAFAAGIPVIASDWHYNAEIVDENINGFIVPIKNVDALEKKIDWSIQNQDAIYGMKKNCLAKAESLSPKQAVKPLIQMLG